MKYFHLIRYKNLGIIALTQCVIKFGFFLPLNIETALSISNFVLLILSTVFIAAGGYIINDIYDIKADKSNNNCRPIAQGLISDKIANIAYIITTALGVILGYILCLAMGKPNFFALFVIIAASLYAYASYLKQLPVVDNVIISLIVGISLLIVGVFELIPIQNEVNKPMQILILKVLLDYALFAFGINLLRELVKDMEDVKGDHLAGYSSLAIVIGTQRSARVTVVLGMLFIFVLAWYGFTYLYDKKMALGVLIFGVIGSLVYGLMKLWEAKSIRDFHRVSNTLKLTMLIGICLIPIITYSIIYAS